jgi:hypothetical protein
MLYVDNQTGYILIKLATLEKKNNTGMARALGVKTAILPDCISG